MKHGVWAMNYPVVRTMAEVVEFAAAAEQAGWDGTMPYWPALLGGTVGPEGQTSSGTIDDELRDLMAFDRELADELGEVVLPRQQRDDAEYRSLAEELDATWLLTSYRMDLDELRQGPPT